MSWERFAATVIVGQSASDLADGEADLVAESSETGRSVEFVGNFGHVRVYRVSA